MLSACGDSPQHFRLSESVAGSDTYTDIDLLWTDPASTDADTDTDTDTNTDTDTDTDIDGETIIEKFGVDEVYKPATPITVDGIVDETAWHLTTPIKNVLEGMTDDSVRFDVLWTMQYLYVGVITNDAVLRRDSAENWNDDSVDVVIDGNNSSTGSLDPHDDHCVITWNVSEIYCNRDNYAEHSGPILHAWHTVAAGGLSVEMDILWSYLKVAPYGGAVIGFDIGSMTMTAD